MFFHLVQTANVFTQILYKSNYMFLNTYGSDMDDYVSTFNSSQVFEGVKKFQICSFR